MHGGRVHALGLCAHDCCASRRDLDRLRCRSGCSSAGCCCCGRGWMQAAAQHNRQALGGTAGLPSAATVGSPTCPQPRAATRGEGNSSGGHATIWLLPSGPPCSWASRPAQEEGGRTRQRSGEAASRMPTRALRRRLQAGRASFVHYRLRHPPLQRAAPSALGDASSLQRGPTNAEHEHSLPAPLAYLLCVCPTASIRAPPSSTHIPPLPSALHCPACTLFFSSPLPVTQPLLPAHALAPLPLQSAGLPPV